MSEYWLVFAFLTPVLGAILAIVNKWLIDKYFKDPVSSLVFMLLGNLIYLIPATFFLKLKMNLFEFFITFLLGIVFGLMYYFQMKVIKVKEASENAILMRFKPVIVMILAFLLLDEALRLRDYFGVIFLTLGGTVVAIKDFKLNKLKFSEYLKPLLLFAIISSFVSIARKVVTVEYDFWSVFYLLNLGSVLGALLLLLSKKHRNNFIKDLKNAPRKVFVTKLLAQIVFVISFVFNMLALKYGPVSVVSATYSIQPLMVLVYAFLISKIYPQVISEDISKKSMFVKILAVIFAIFGSVLVS